MTGFAEIHRSDATGALRIEVRSVNNRHLKLTVRGSDPYPMLEGEFEKIVRRHLQRGTINLNIHVERPKRSGDYRINDVALRSYLEQLERSCAVAGREKLLAALTPGLLTLPGVVEEPTENRAALAEDWPRIESAVLLALEKLQQMRQTEGEAMGHELLKLRGQLSGRLNEVRDRSAESVSQYRQRLLHKLGLLFEGTSIAVGTPEVLREVAIYAERSDIAEEITRLESHLEQMTAIVNTENDTPGRKLDFLTQEMFREINTIGSKSPDTHIARHVVEMKSILEKIRELVQNVE